MSRIDSVIHRYVGASAAHPYRWLLVYTTLSALCVWFGRDIDVSTDLKRLLPQDTPSVAALEQVERRRGSTELYTIAVESPDPYANVDFIEDAAAIVAREWPEARWVQVAQDPTFFNDHLLLYLPVYRLESLRDELSLAFRCEVQRTNPLYVELGGACDEDWQEPGWTFESWFTSDLAAEIGVPRSWFEEWRGRRESSGQDESTAGGDDGLEPAQPSVPNALRHYNISDDGTVAVLYAQLDRLSTDIQFANLMQQRGTDLIAALDPSAYHAEMRAEVVGAFQSMNEARSAQEDADKSLAVSLTLVTTILLLYFRRLRGLVIVVLPLTMGVSWSVAMTRLTIGELNLYTVFVGSLLIGIGTDYGVHLYGRTLETFRGGEPLEEALSHALRLTGRAILASAVTSTCAFLTLLMSHFRGFAEYAIITSYGIFLCMFSAWLVTPPLALAFERLLPMSGRGGSRKSRVEGRFRFPWIAAFVVAMGLATWASLLAPEAEFEYDFRNLRGPSSSASIGYLKAVRTASTAPSIALGSSREQLREVHALLLHRLRDERDPWLSGFLTIESLVPSDQEGRAEIMADLAQRLGRRAYRRLEGEPRRLLERMQELTGAQPFGLDEVPSWATRMLTESDGTVGHLGLIFAKVAGWDIHEVRAYQSRYATLEVPSGSVPVASSTFITADVVSTVQADGERVGAWVAIVVLAVLLVSLRSVLGALVCMAAMFVAFLLTLGVMVLTGTKVGMYNMIVLPTVIGISIDGAIHLFHRFREEGHLGVNHLMRTTGLAVLFASLTNGSGFVGLLFQRHLGIRSIGELALIGLLAALISVVIFMPGVMAVLSWARRAFKVTKP